MCGWQFSEHQDNDISSIDKRNKPAVTKDLQDKNKTSITLTTACNRAAVSDSPSRLIP